MNKLDIPTVTAPANVTLKSLKSSTNVLMPVVMARLEAILRNEQSSQKDILTACDKVIKLHLHILEQERLEAFDKQQKELNDIKIKRERIELGEKTDDDVNKSGSRPLTFQNPKGKTLS